MPKLPHCLTCHAFCRGKPDGRLTRGLHFCNQDGHGDEVVAKYFPQNALKLSQELAHTPIHTRSTSPQNAPQTEWQPCCNCNFDIQCDVGGHGVYGCWMSSVLTWLDRLGLARWRGFAALPWRLSSPGTLPDTDRQRSERQGFRLLCAALGVPSLSARARRQCLWPWNRSHTAPKALSHWVGRGCRPAGFIINYCVAQVADSDSIAALHRLSLICVSAHRSRQYVSVALP